MKRTDDSAQMILISSFAIGLSIVVLTLLLNNIIYASNTASESTVETNVFALSNNMQITIDAYEKAYSYAFNGSSLDKNKFDDYLDTYTQKMSESSAFAGAVYTLEDGNFQEPYFTRNGLINGESNWTVAERVNTTDQFLMAVNTSSIGNSSDRFTVQAVNKSGTIWSASFFRSPGGVNVTVTDGVNILNSGESVSGELNITSNLVDGSSAFDYHFASRTSGQNYSINIINGEQASGTCLISGQKLNGNSFEIERIDVIEVKIRMNKDGKLEGVFVIPIVLPEGQT